MQIEIEVKGSVNKIFQHCKLLTLLFCFNSFKHTIEFPIVFF